MALCANWALATSAPAQGWVAITADGVRPSALGVPSKRFGPSGRFVYLEQLPQKNILDKYIISVQEDLRYELFDDAHHRKSEDPEFEKSWGLNNVGQLLPNSLPGRVGADVGALKAWGIHTGSKKSIVAVIDSGIELLHEDLAANIWNNPAEIAGNGVDDDKNGFIDDVHGWNFYGQNNDPSDRNGHGTRCAGIIASVSANGKGSMGVNWDTQLMAVRFTNDAGFGTTKNSIEAITYAVENGATVINASWGGNTYDPALFWAVKWAGEQGVLFVSAAGNAGKNNDTWKSPTFPASFRLATQLSVAAYDNQDVLASFSSYGKETTHLGAPGVDIFTTSLGGYAFVDGTSYAAPFVAGAAALLKSFEPELSLNQLRQRLMQTSEVIHYYEKENTQSAGRVHLYNALRDIRPHRPVEPTDWVRVSSTWETEHPYGSDLDSNFSIVHPGASHLRVHFRVFETEWDLDEVQVFDKQGRRVAVYSGALGEFTSADVIGDELRIQFKTDMAVELDGYVIDYYEVSFDPTLWSLLDGLPNWNGIFGQVKNILGKQMSLPRRINQ